MILQQIEYSNFLIIFVFFCKKIGSVRFDSVKMNWIRCIQAMKILNYVQLIDSLRWNRYQFSWSIGLPIFRIKNLILITSKLWGSSEHSSQVELRSETSQQAPWSPEEDGRQRAAKADDADIPYELWDSPFWNVCCLLLHVPLSSLPLFNEVQRELPLLL